MKVSKKYLSFFLILGITTIYSLTQTGVIYIRVTNQPPIINWIKFTDSVGNIINHTEIEIADAAGNLRHYRLYINTTDLNTLQDINKIVVEFKGIDCSSINEQCYLKFIYNSSGIFKYPSSQEFNVSLISLPNLSTDTGVYTFDITFPKVAKRYNSFNWSINVTVYDSSGNYANTVLSNLFDFSYYAELVIPQSITLGPIGPGKQISKKMFINVTAVNANSMIRIYTTSQYVLDSNDNPVTSWPVSYIKIGVDNVYYNITQGVNLSITGPQRNYSKEITWNITVPYGIKSGTYHFYYTVEINEA